MADTEPKLQENQPMKTQKVFLIGQIFLRTLTIAATLGAAWIMLTNKQTIEIGGFIMDARYDYSSAFKFFAIANVVALGFSVLSLLTLLCASRRGSNPTHYFILFLHDLLMMSLVLAGCAAATTMGFLGKYGNDHTGWMPICDHFGRFCNRGTTSVILSYLALIFLLMLTVISASKSRQIQV